MTAITGAVTTRCGKPLEHFVDRGTYGESFQTETRRTPLQPKTERASELGAIDRAIERRVERPSESASN